MKKNHYHVIGVMSGTSLDGIDVAELFFDCSNPNNWKFKIAQTDLVAYSKEWKQRLQQAITLSETDLDLLNDLYTKYLAESIDSFIKKNEIKEIDAICSHGHTIKHRPDKGITLQIGNSSELANLLGQKVVCDFRVQDVKLGGQGAPLVPIGDRLLFSEYDYCLNLGGFANVSYEENGARIAYDICPVNIVLNKYAEMLGFPYDNGGRIASSVSFDQWVFKELNELKYYDEQPPKSLGLEWVQQTIFPILELAKMEAKVVLSTFCEHIAFQTATQFHKGATVLVTGGGAFNEYLISRIRFYNEVNLVLPSKELIEFKESLIFGLLGVLKMREEINCLASVTGAIKDHSSGKIFFPETL